MILISRKKPVDARINIIRGSHPSVAENTTAVATIQAAGAGTMTYSIVAGNDGAKFSIVGATGVLTFASAPDYETPTDANTDNIYLVTVRASNDGNPVLTDDRLLFVTVTDVVVEGGPNLFTNPTFTTDTAWTKEGGWTISGGTANATLQTAFIHQAVTLTAAHTYRVAMTVTRTAGTIAYGSYDGEATGTARSSSGTFSEDFVASAGDAASANFGFSASGFSGTLDDVSITDIT
jgi:hypothetical protein